MFPRKCKSALDVAGERDGGSVLRRAAGALGYEASGRFGIIHELDLATCPESVTPRLRRLKTSAILFRRRKYSRTKEVFNARGRPACRVTNSLFDFLDKRE